MGIQLGGPKAWKVRVFRDIGVAYHWINEEPSMCLFPAQAKSSPNRGAFVIPLSAACDYVDSNGYPTIDAMERAAIAAQVMCLDTTKGTLVNIVDAIMDGIEDLIVMPPEPDEAKRLIGEALLKMDGKIVSHTGITQ